MKTLDVTLKDLRLISRDHFGLAGLLIVPIVVIVVVAAATQSSDGSKSIVFPVVNEDQGPVATALIRAFREHLDVREVTRTKAHHLVAEANDAAAALILLPELSKRYLAQKPSNVELLTDPAQWQELAAIKIVMLLADRETATLGDPFSQELLTVHERSITGDHLSFSSLEQNIPGFSLMFVLLTLIFQRVARVARGGGVEHERAAFDRARGSRFASRRKASCALDRRDRAIAVAIDVRPLRLRLEARPFLYRDDRGRNCGRRSDDLLCRRGRGLRAYP